jgi:short-subunit dehydrogenase
MSLRSNVALFAISEVGAGLALVQSAMADQTYGLKKVASFDHQVTGVSANGPAVMVMMRLIRYALLLISIALLAGCATAELSQTDKEKLSGKTFVITGASSGFGRGTAVALGSMHANVVLAARRTALLEEVATQVKQAGGSALVVTTDVTEPEAVRNLMVATLARFGTVDVWINNAGTGAIGRFEAIPLEDHSRVIDVTLKGVVNGSYVAMKQFRKQGYGSLINVGSVDSEVPLAYQSSYAASKAAVLSLSRTLNEEIRLSGSDTIFVSTVMPWAVDTPWWEHAANYSGHTPRMASMDDPQKVVNAIVRAAVYPNEEIPVGWKAQSAVWSHRLAPDITERFSANIAHHYQMEQAPPAPSSDGSLFKPMESGREVSGGVRERMERGDAARHQ